MERAGEHSVPSGPLAVRWLAYDPGPPRHGAARLRERGDGALAPGRRAARLPRLPLARRAREPNRLGRALDGAAARGRAGRARGGRPDRARASAPGALPAL